MEQVGHQVVEVAAGRKRSSRGAAARRGHDAVQHAHAAVARGCLPRGSLGIRRAIAKAAAEEAADADAPVPIHPLERPPSEPMRRLLERSLSVAAVA